MRTAAAIVIGLVLAANVQAGQSAPGEQVLAAMGLSGIQIMSDEQALSVRGQGFDTGQDLMSDRMEKYRKNISDFHSEVADFKDDHKDGSSGKDCKGSKPHDGGNRPPKDCGGHMKSPKDCGHKPPHDGGHMKPPHSGGKKW